VTAARLTAVALAAIVLVACTPMRVEVTEIVGTDPGLVFDILNQSTELRELRYEIAQPNGESAGSTSVGPCARTVVAFGRASRTIELAVDGERFGSYTVTPADARAGWLVMRIRIGPGGDAILVGVAATENGPQAEIVPVPGCED
jgi:hypothetical protein